MAVSITDYQCPTVVKDFLFYMSTIKGLSPRTVAAYYSDIRLFLRYLEAVRVNDTMENPNLDNIDISNVTTDAIFKITISDAYGFLNFVQSVNENNANTRARKVSSLRSFYKYLTTKAGMMAENPLKNLETPNIRKSLPKYLTLEESLALLNVIDGPTPQKERDYAMITLLLNCGMRLSELVGIKKGSIRDNVLVLLGKGNKERIIYLNDACLSALEGYYKVRKEPLDVKSREYLFLSKNGAQISPRRVEQIVERNLGLAGLGGRGFSPHKLRHTAATLMYQHGGVDIRVLKEILGHENLSTTEIYTHVSNSQIETAVQKNPLGKVVAPEKKEIVTLKPKDTSNGDDQ